MADNANVAHGATQFLALVASVRGYANACLAASQAVRVKLNAATAAAAVGLMDIASGYPPN